MIHTEHVTDEKAEDGDKQNIRRRDEAGLGNGRVKNPDLLQDGAAAK